MKKIFKSSLLIVLASTLVGCTTSQIVYYATALSLEDILNAADKNFTRDSEIYLTDEALEEINKTNGFTLTLARTTLWTENALYMYGSNNVNSGYLNDGNHMKHFYLDNGSNDIDSEDATNVIVDRDDGEHNIHTFDGFGTLHKIKSKSLNLNERFDLDGNNRTRAMTFGEGDDEIKQEFMYFIAPLFRNVDNYFDFSRVEVSLIDDVVTYSLYTDDNLDMLDNENGLFAKAEVRNIGLTTIPVVNAYFDSLNI